MAMYSSKRSVGWLKSWWLKQQARKMLRDSFVLSFRVRDKVYIVMPDGQLYQLEWNKWGDPSNPSTWVFYPITHL